MTSSIPQDAQAVCLSARRHCSGMPQVQLRLFHRETLKAEQMPAMPEHLAGRACGPDYRDVKPSS